MSRPRGRSATCVIMEGYLTIPPDRGTILGRAIWKTRYVVIGSAQGEVDDGKSRSSMSSDGITYLSIYKNPDDWEPSQQYAASNITSCEVQQVSHRKQGPVLPTLIITITPDPATEKLRKRRSSRAATLVSNKDNGPTTLWFRTEGDASKLQEWARSIQVASQPSFPDSLLMSPMSPMSSVGPLTPGSPSFHNPFGAYGHRDGSEFCFPGTGRPPSAPSAPRVSLHHKASSSLHTHRERPLTISDAPSLRSRRSDLSSLPGSIANASMTQIYAPMPADMPAPSEGDAELFGWTSAQGRSTNIHSPARTVRDSLNFNAQLSPTTLLNSGSSPPGPRETILDRAFQLKYIPGSDQTVPGEEKLSSLARFEALMQQVENKRGAETRKRSVRHMSVREQLEFKSAWELDESDEDDEDSDSDDSDDTEGESATDRDTEADNRGIRPESRKPATFSISHQQQQQQQQRQQQQQQQSRQQHQQSRQQHQQRQQHKPAPQTPPQSPRGTAGIRSPITLNPEALAALVSTDDSPERPRLAHRMHNAMGSLSLGVNPSSMAHLNGASNQHITNSLEASPGKSSSSSSSGGGEIYEETSGLNPAAAYRTSTILEGQQLHRLSAASSNGGKRLSFTDFTRRLSSTGSMLLSSSQVGTPTGNGDAADGQLGSSQSRRSSVYQPRAPPAAMGAGQGTDRNEKCKNWRNSVGMFGNEGGFL